MRSDQSAQVVSSGLLEVKGARVRRVRRVRFRLALEEAQSRGAAGDAAAEGWSSCWSVPLGRMPGEDAESDAPFPAGFEEKLPAAIDQLLARRCGGDLKQCLLLLLQLAQTGHLKLTLPGAPACLEPSPKRSCKHSKKISDLCS